MRRGQAPTLGFGLGCDPSLSGSRTATRSPQSRYSGAGLGHCQYQGAQPVTAAGQSGAGAPDALQHPEIQGPPLPQGSAQDLVAPLSWFLRGSSLVEDVCCTGTLWHPSPGGGNDPPGLAGYRGLWRQARLLALRPLTATSPVTGSKVLLVPVPRSS